MIRGAAVAATVWTAMIALALAQPSPNDNRPPPKVVGPGVKDAAPAQKAPPAKADPRDLARRPAIVGTPMAPVTPGVVAYHATGEIAASRDGGLGVMRTVPSGPLARTAALSYFRFSWSNGDHKFRHLRLMPDARDGQVSLAFTDQNDDDPWNIRATWWNVNAGDKNRGTEERYAVGAGAFDIPLTGDAGFTPALKGFLFERAAGTDANVRSIGIELLPATAAHRRLDPAANWIARVRLFDDEGADFRNPARAAGVVLSPIESFAGYGLGAAAISARGGTRGFLAGVQIAWIPNSAIRASGSVSGGQYGRDSAAIPDGPAVMTGFQFEYLNSDHHLWALHAMTRNGGDGVMRDFLHGNNALAPPDDPLAWWISYAALRPPPS